MKLPLRPLLHYGGAISILLRAIVLSSSLLHVGLVTCLAAPESVVVPITILPSIRTARYQVALSGKEARFQVNLELESTAPRVTGLTLFEGDLAVSAPKLPPGLHLVRIGNRYRLMVDRPGRYQARLEFIARIVRTEDWNQVVLTGPTAAIAEVMAEVSGDGSELQLLTGTTLESIRTNHAVRVRGFLSADHTVSLRWTERSGQSSARPSLVTCETTGSIQLTPNLVKVQTRLNFDLVQGARPGFVITVPAGQALTRVEGEQIRNWQVQVEGDRSVLHIELIKPVEKSYSLTLYSEQTLDDAKPIAGVELPQPLEVERETGTLSIAAADIQAEIDGVSGLRQINPGPGAVAAYRFNARPFTLSARLRRLEPVIQAVSQVAVRLEESRLVAAHTIDLQVEKAGVYSIELSPLVDSSVTEVRGEVVDDWAVRDGRLHVNFSSRLFGRRRIEVRLERSFQRFPESVTIPALRVVEAVRQTAEMGATAAPGIQLKTSEMSGLREIPAANLGHRGDAVLGFVASQLDWSVTLAAERLAPRIVAEIFNLATIGDGLVGGSATIRYGILNQGVQEFRVQVPRHWKNVEFTGPNIRRRDHEGSVWTIGLQEKAWDGYTLVVTYDQSFDPHKATLDLGGIHALEAERETGSIAVTSAASLELREGSALEPLRRVDENELSEADRALVTRAVLLAYQYAGTNYSLTLNVSRFDQLPVLPAVADRTQLTTVLTEGGQMLTQASFMVKNNEKQFQTFTLPAGAEFWSCFVNNLPVKAERQGAALLVPLPRAANRDQSFAVQLVYAQKSAPVAGLLPQPLRLAAPKTDIQTTFAEWELYVPATHWLTRFQGNMTVARGTVYSLGDALEEFTGVYRDLFRQSAGLALAVLALGAFVAIIVALVRRGLVGVVNVLAVLALLAILGGMLLPALAKAKSRAQRINAVSNLKQIGVALRLHSNDNGGGAYPASLNEVLAELSSERVLIDPQSGQRFEYIGAGRDESTPDVIIAYSPTDADGGRAVLFADGSASQMSSAKFAEVLAAMAVKGGANGSAPPASAPAMGQVGQVVQPAAPAGSGLMATPVPTAPVVTTASGLRPIHIEIPRTGQKFTFTKVLNVLDEPLTVEAATFSLKSRERAEGALHLGLFLGGILLAAIQLRRVRPRRLPVAIGLLLAGCGVGRWLIDIRLLGTALVLAAPAIVLLAVILAVRRYWRRRIPAASESSGLDSGSAPLPPVVAAVIFLALTAGWSRAAAPAAISTNRPGARIPAKTIAITAARYSGVVHDRVAELEAVFQVAADSDQAVLPLFGPDVVLQEFSASTRDVRIFNDAGGIRVRLGRRGESTLRCKLLVKTEGEMPQRQLRFAIPSALTSEVALTLDEAEATVSFPSAVSFNTAAASGQTRVTGVIGAANRVEMSWSPRIKRAAEIAATVFCQNAALVQFHRGVINIHSVIEYQVSQGEMRETRLIIPAGHRLLRVEGEGVRTWSTRDENGGSILTVELLKGVTTAWRLTVETEQSLETLPARIAVRLPHPLEVKRETGWIALGAGDELGVAVTESGGLQKVDAVEFIRAVPSATLPPIAIAYRFLKADHTLTARVEALQPQIEAVVLNQFVIQNDGVSLASQVNYTIKQAGVFTLRLAVPADFSVESVTGTNLAQWIVKETGGAREIEATLKERTLGTGVLHVRLNRTWTALPGTIAVESVRPLAVARFTGWVLVEPGPGLRLRTETVEGWTEIPTATFPPAIFRATTSGALAFKAPPFAAADAAPPAKLSVTTERIDPWVRADIVNWLTLNGTLVQGRAVIRYEIQNAPVKEFALRVPAAFRNVEISGANIRRRDQSTNDWRVELQSRVTGSYTLTVTWEQPWSVREQSTELAVGGLQTLGTERETGAIAVVAKASLKVEGKSASADVIRIDPRELPEWAGAVDQATALAWRYLRTGYALTLAAQRFNAADVLQALIDEARLTSVMADDGQMMTELVLSVRNNGRQHIEITLPPKAEVWSAFVGGHAVRPSRRDGKVLLPLERIDDRNEAVPVELTFVSAAAFPKGRGSVVLVSPSFDVPVKNARWELFLPPDHDYRQSGGSMKFTADAAPILQTFSSSDYSLIESRNKVLRKAEAALQLNRARSELARGNMKEASRAYKQVREAVVDQKTGEDLAELEKDLNRRQGSNLIVAQSNFSALNNEPAPNAAQVQSPGKGVQYDARAAEQQWLKLQQAQEVVTTQVRPLRVNLPTRGLRHAFSQVLQTELRRPMTIEFQVNGVASSQWPIRTALAALGLLIVWAFATLLTPGRQG